MKPTKGDRMPAVVVLAQRRGAMFLHRLLLHPRTHPQALNVLCAQCTLADGRMNATADADP